MPGKASGCDTPPVATITCRAASARTRSRSRTATRALPGSVVSFAYRPTHSAEQRTSAAPASSGDEVVVSEAVGEGEVGGAEEVPLNAERHVLALAPHPLYGRHAARGHAGDAVHAHQALAAGALQAERSARPVVLDRSGEGGDARAEQRSRDGVSWSRFDGRAVEEDAGQWNALITQSRDQIAEKT